jgi:hypothetical protein
LTRPHLIVPRLSRSVYAASVAIAATVALLAGAPAAIASHSQVSIMQDDPQLLSNPGPALQTMRALGATAVRIAVRWQAIAPSPNSFRAPNGLQASNPAAYRAATWAPYDAIVRDAKTDGLAVNFAVIGGAPLWATGPGQPRKIHGYPFHNWEPSAAKYGSFVRALGVRYSGSYNPATKTTQPGNPGDLPRVSLWSIWNEPTYGPSLAPQALPGHPGVEDSPRLYRGLVGAAWSALHATGHGADTIIIGEITPRNSTDSLTKFGNFNGMWPLQFLRALYCVDSRYRELRGTAASLRGCPTTAAGSAQFAAQNPGLFQASGFADHPYTDGLPPNQELMPSPNGTGLTELGQLTGALDRLVATYGGHKHYPIWITEYGFLTSPPKLPHPTPKDHSIYPSQSTSAYYDNWSEYLAWKNARVASFDQYMLKDALPRLASNDYGGFASGLLDYQGHQKPGYAAWRMPLYMPVTNAVSGASLEVWGGVRPAFYAMLDMPKQPESVNIMFEPQGSTSFSVLDTVALSSPQGYFDTRETFPSSGTVQLQWTYPADSLLGTAGQTVYSRKVEITLSG